MSVELVDLSNNNLEPDWHELAAAGVVGVELKVTEGLGFVDETYLERRHAARAVGLRTGGYHFFDASLDPLAQAHFFAKHLGPIGPHDLRPWLDLERLDGVTPSVAVAGARTFNRNVLELTGTGPALYSDKGFLEQLAPARPIGYGLWLADFGPDDGSEHPTSAPPPWRHYIAHQYTGKGTVPGCHGNTDRSSAAELRPLLAHPPPRT